MSKAILVIDMPECCADCPCSFFERDNPKLNLICGIEQEDANNVGRPDWCPLKSIPEKKETCSTIECYSNGEWTEGMKAGYNACIDEILKGGAKNENIKK